MNQPMNQKSEQRFYALRTVVCIVVFLSLTCLLFLLFQGDKQLTQPAQRILYSLGFGGLLAGLAILLISVYLEEGAPVAHSRWFYPAMAGLLGFACMGLAYMYLGVWPVGDRSVMVVDMHHQYAPLLAQLRERILHGGSPLYSFDVGLGSSFLPLFAYYLSSPFNLLLVLFPESMLNEGILVITLLKNALTAFCFAVCVQYLYHRRDLSVVAVSVLYSMMMYLIAYSWDIMWLDCVMILPIVVMSFEKLMRTGKYLPYVLSLAYTMYANYYIGFMVCLFLVLYFVVYTVRARRSAAERWRCFGRAAVGSILGCGLVAFLLAPTILSLAHTSAAASSGLEEMTNKFALFDFLGRHLYESSPTIRSGNLPNVYCGILTVILLPVFATLRSIPLRRRLSYLGLAAAIAFSMVLSQFDLIWHGLHAPNDLPYRYSFLYCFVLLLIAFETLGHIREIRFRQLGGTLAALLAYLMLAERFGTLGEPAKSGEYSFESIYISLLLAVIYAAILLAAARRRLPQRAAYCLLLLVVTVEAVTNGGASFKAVNASEYFTARNDYAASAAAEARRLAVGRTKEIGDAAADGAFYRLEFLPRHTTVDTALYDYPGLTVFASSNPQSVTKFMDYLGYANNGVNSYLYRSFVPTTDSLLGLKYVIMNRDLGSHPQLTLIEQSGTAENPYYIYENTTALPVGFLVDSSIKSWQPTRYNPIASQNSLYASMTGNSAELFALAPLSTDLTGIGRVGESTSFTLSASSTQTTAVFDAVVAESGRVFVYVDCGAAQSINIGYGDTNWSSSPGEPYIIDAGTLSAGDTLSVTVSAESGCSGNIYVATLRDEVFEQQMAALQESPFVVTESSDTRLYGTVNAAKAGVLFTSIPYDEGWTVRVDGQEVETFAAGDAMLAFDLAAGEHTVEITFFPSGLLPGIVWSLICLALLILLLWFIQKKVNRRNPADDEFRAFSRLLSQPARHDAFGAGAFPAGEWVEPADTATPAPGGSAALPDGAPAGQDTPPGTDGIDDTNGGKEGTGDDYHPDAGI